jgi:hypothetical protein
MLSVVNCRLADDEMAELDTVCHVSGKMIDVYCWVWVGVADGTLVCHVSGNKR